MSIKSIYYFSAVFFLSLSFNVTNAEAQYPEKDITVIIPYSAGGGNDSYVRGVLPAMQK